MKKIKMTIKDLRVSRINLFYDILLVDEDNNKALSISVGKYEAENMAIFLDNLKTPRPLTYDSFCSVLKTYQITLQEIVISRFMDGNYYAVCVFVNEKGEKKEFDIRPSDAINLALRYNCPIYALENVIKDAGFEAQTYFDEQLKEQMQNEMETLENMSEFGINMLKDLLNDAIENEDYKRASILRDRIRKLEEGI
ncbi:MAG: DUF151 domain-containing protein [Bacteroidota bacterium]|nr:DUF151 domain-containing protein [Bacteroidota bacterium]